MPNRAFAEVFGTFCLVFAGTGAIVVNDMSGGSITHAGIAIVFGLVVMAMIHTVGDISGAHLNPAVTLGMWTAGRLPATAVMPYIASQMVGGVAASLLVRGLFPQHATLGATLPSGPVWQSFILEVVCTMMLMVVILRVSSGSKERGLLAGITVGGLIGLEALFAGPISGASMNPARSLAPALVTLQLGAVWIYLVAPVMGALGGVVVYTLLRDDA